MDHNRQSVRSYITATTLHFSNNRALKLWGKKSLSASSLSKASKNTMVSNWITFRRN